MDVAETLVPIGRFSKMTRLSIKALRHYDDIGLLNPAWVDPGSGYRYYRIRQARRAEAIRQLRLTEMPLDEISEILGQHDPVITRKLLDHHRQRLIERLDDQQRRLRYLEILIEREEGIMPYEVTVKELPAQQVAGIRKHVNLSNIGEAIGEGFGEVVAAVATSGQQPAGIPFIIYHDVIDEDTAGDVEICVPTATAIEDRGEVRALELEATTVASTIHHGPYEEIAPAYHSLMGWIQEHGHEMAGAPREIYLNDPTTVEPEEILTEVAWPIK